MSERRSARRMDCIDAAELVPELALGLLDGAERAAVLAHVEGCDRCRSDLAGLTQVGENLLLLAPEAEPPPAFESRVLARVAPPRRRRVPWRPLMAAAAALAVLLVAGAVLALTGGDGDDDLRAGSGSTSATTEPDSVVATVDMMNDDGDVVAVASYHRGESGEPGMLELDMADWVAELEDRGIPDDAQWWLVLDDATGKHHRYPLAVTPTAEVRLVHGPTAGAAITAAITTSEGRVLCSGTFEPAD